MKRVATIVTAVAVLLGTRTLWAQQEEQPSNDKHLKNAEWLIGTWESKGTVPEGAPLAGQKYVFRVCQEWILNKNAIAIDLTFTTAEKSSSAKVLMGWNPSTSQIMSCSFSSDGGFGKGVVQMEQGRMVLKEAGFQADGTRTGFKVELILQDKDTLLRKVTEQKQGDKTLPDNEDTLRRVK